MTKRHEELMRDVLGGLPATGTPPQPAAAPARETRFLKRSTGLAERLSGDRVEKTLLWVDPARCRMWERHNRRYDLLNESNCADLIEGIKAQGGQEFPAIVRRVSDGRHDFEVICGARRHWAISWLRANTYPQFRFLVEVRDLTDEEAFRLSDIENRDRQDISDWERACDYAEAVRLYYGGRQKRMAERLEVSESWLSRYLDLARLPRRIVAAYRDVTEIRESHARALKPLLADPATRERVLARADAIAAEQAERPISAPAVLAALRAAARRPAPRPAARSYPAPDGSGAITVQARGRSIRAEFPATLSRDALEAAFRAYLADRFGEG
ncbi:MAG: ParB/RepB/Spo0J family partition protein [Alphaproteobacteria bacterium]|nr:MAG: ParB/RepB/Spo0J family partition protein [Alphaproteobacteria bacterium]